MTRDQLVTDLFNKGVMYSYIGKKLGVSRQRAHQICVRLGLLDSGRRFPRQVLHRKCHRCDAEMSGSPARIRARKFCSVECRKLHDAERRASPEELRQRRNARMRRYFRERYQSDPEFRETIRKRNQSYAQRRRGASKSGASETIDGSGTPGKLTE